MVGHVYFSIRTCWFKPTGKSRWMNNHIAVASADRTWLKRGRASVVWWWLYDSTAFGIGGDEFVLFYWYMCLLICMCSMFLSFLGTLHSIYCNVCYSEKEVINKETIWQMMFSFQYLEYWIFFQGWIRFSLRHLD